MVAAPKLFDRIAMDQQGRRRPTFPKPDWRLSSAEPAGLSDHRPEQQFAFEAGRIDDGTNGLMSTDIPSGNMVRQGSHHQRGGK